ncbi:MAG: transglutaminase [Aeromicrobium sp.]|nr:transglutaminase [Aeromicrobium sp.]
MKRTVSAHLELQLHDAADLVFSVAVAADNPLASETISIISNGTELEATELVSEHGTRLHRLSGARGPLTMHYEAVIDGQAEPAPYRELDVVTYRRPSRYAESDTLFATAQSEFAGLSGKDLLDAVSSWVGDRLSYVPGTSQPTDGAVATLLARRGVCRDYAHLVIALLRGLDVPARLASVYAPGLFPMDFHAVAEAWFDDQWNVLDATTLAPRSSLVRIATGQDASETAFLSQYGAAVDLRWIEVTAVVDVLPLDDLSELVQLR